jgi:pimeloyl-ACP methyl ester carboxylesterase
VIDLPGMGRDKTPIQKVKMATTAESLCSLIDGIDGKLILVGHSKNGIMISQVDEYRPGKIEKLVYQAAYLISVALNFDLNSQPKLDRIKYSVTSFHS